MTDDYTEEENRRINRRTVLRSAGLMGATVFSGVAAGQGGPPGKGGGPPEDGGGPPGNSGGPPCHRDFSCDNGETYVKYELVELEDDTCEFQEETNTGIYEDSLTITDCEGGDSVEDCEGSCEPLAVSWNNSKFETTTLKAKGSTECESPEGDPGGSYTSGLETPSGQRAAISNLQFCVEEVEEEPLECPDGTGPLATYNVEGKNITCESGEDVVEFSNLTTNSSGDLTGFDFSSTDGSDDNSEPETLTTVTVAYDDTVETFEVDPDFETDKQSGSIPVDGPIDRVLFCQAVYAQADFVTGDVIRDLCNNQYSEDKIVSITWSSYNGQLDGTQGQFDGGFTFNSDGTLTVDYDQADDGVKVLSLAVYEVDDPEFRDNNNISFSDTRCRQTLVDSDSDEVGNQDGTLTAYLPSV